MTRNRISLVNIVVSLMIVCVAHAADEEASRRSPDSTFDIIQYKAPPGWKPADRPDAPTKVYASPDSNFAQQAFLVMGVTAPEPNFNFPATFDRAVKSAAGNATVTESTPAVATKTRQGLDALSQTLVAQNAAAQKLYV